MQDDVFYESFPEKARALFRKFYSVPFSSSSWDSREYATVWSCLSSGAVASGNAVGLLERQFENTLDARIAKGVNSGEAGLYCILRALKESEGKRQRDEVVIPSYCCGSVLYAVQNAGLKPVFADIGFDYNLSPESAFEKISGKTLAVLVPSLYGKPAALDVFEKKLPKMQDNGNVFLVDDAAQCLGASKNGKPVGNFGIAGVHSFGAKAITATAGGMIVSSNPSHPAVRKALSIAESLPSEKTSTLIFRLVDCAMRYSHRKTFLPFLTLKYLAQQKLGRKAVKTYSRLSNLDAEIASAQLRKVGKINALRRRNAKILLDVLASSEFELPDFEKQHVFYKFAVRLPKKGESRRTKPWPELRKFVRLMAQRGVECEWCYVPLRLRFSSAEKRGETLPVTEDVWWRSIALPNHPGLSEEQMKQVAITAKKTLAEL
ncbi:MAG: DegT/DnrJ/EryC1/StrS family aminotransferase [Candidatus Norongarragalinales archaeon]